MERVYVNKPRTLEQLKENIRAEIRISQPRAFTIVMKHAIERARHRQELNRTKYVIKYKYSYLCFKFSELWINPYKNKFHKPSNTREKGKLR